MFNEFKLKENVILKNRIVVAPMTTWSGNDDLTISNEEIEYYKYRSEDVGMFITACTFFQPNGQGFENQFYAGTDNYIDSLKKLADAIKFNGAKGILQIFHAGRKADPSKGVLISASAVKPTSTSYGTLESLPVPKEMTEEEINEIIEGFYSTTVRAIKAGFDGIEIHGANTYLLQQFFSPHSNKRSDQWGGSLENRMKLILEVINSVNRAKKEFGKEEFIIGYRFSPEEIEEPGITIEDTLALVDTLSGQDIDYLHISLKDYNATSSRDENDKRIIGKLISEKINGRKPLIGVGSITTKEKAEDAINLCYDLVALGRILLTEPKWVHKIKNNEEIIDYIDLKNPKEQYLPEKMVKKIEGIPGWINLK